MPRKKTTAPEKQYIAFDDYTETIIARGPLKEVVELIEVHVEDEGYNEDDVIENIGVFELGEEMTVRAFSKGLEITVES